MNLQQFVSCGGTAMRQLSDARLGTEMTHLPKSFASLLRELGQLSRSKDPLPVLAKTAAKSFDAVLVEVWERTETESGSVSLLRRAVEAPARAGRPKEVPKVSPQYQARLRGLRRAYAGPPFAELPPECAGGQAPLRLWVQPIVVGERVAGFLTLYRAALAEEPALHWFRAFADLAALVLDRSRLVQRSDKATAHLHSVMEASKVLHSTLDLEELLGLILRLATFAVDADRGTVFLVDSQARELWSLVALGLQREEIRLPLGRGVAGHVAQTGEVVNAPDAYQHPFFDPSFDQRFDYRTRNMLCMPIRNPRGEVLGVLELLNKKEGEFSQEDIDLLVTLSTPMALALENAQRHREFLAKQRIEKELALAREIQRGLLPSIPPLVPGYDIALRHEPCFEVGGDYYDFLSLGPNTLLVVADVEGKGVSSALVMSNLQASLRALVMSQHSLEVITRSLNNMIREDTKSQKFVSIFLGLIDVPGGKLHYINAGHVPPLLVRDSNEVVSLGIGGIVIGLFDSPDYTRGLIQLRPGDTLLLCTDGIVEATGLNQEEEYGTQRLLELVRENRRRTAQELVEAAWKDVERFSRGSVHADDRVLIVVKAREQPPA